MASAGRSAGKHPDEPDDWSDQAARRRSQRARREPKGEPHGRGTIVVKIGTGQNIMTADDTNLTGQSTGTVVVLETIDISVADQQFGITLADVDITIIGGNTKPTSSVTTLTDIADATVTYTSAATDTGMGSYAIDPDFDLEVRAEVYEGTYTATVTLANITGP